MKVSGLAVIAGLCILSSSAMAEVYVGVGGGLTHSNAATKLEDSVYHNGTDQKDENDAGLIIFGGYSFNKYISVEADYVDLGSYQYSGTNAYDYPLKMKLEAHGISIAAVGTWPITDSIGVDGKLGIGETTQKFSCISACVNVSDNDKTSLALVGGIGVHWDALQNLRVRAAYEHFGGGHFTAYDSNGDKFDRVVDYGLLYAGAELRF